MADQIRDLIQKIHEEGVKAAEEKARQIEAEAQEKAAAIIAKARQQADGLLAEVHQKDKKLKESTQTLLKQAARDMLLDLRKEIFAMLEEIVNVRVHEALGHLEIAKLIIALVRQADVSKGGIVISLAKEDLKKLENSVLAELKEGLKKGVVLKASDEISAGFIISYDAGKSHFDFTDKALAEYISSQVKPKLAEILKG